MIRKLKEADHSRLMTLLHKDPAINLYIIGDVENFGMEQPFMELWGEADEADGAIHAVMMRFYASFICYADGPFDVAGFAGLLSAADKADMLSGSTEVVSQFSKQIDFRIQKHMVFAELKEKNEALRSMAEAAEGFSRATLQDVEEICSLTDRIDEFSASPDDSRQSMRTKLESKTGRTYFAKQDGQTIITASTVAENSISAMIVAVATHPEYRGQGLATKAVARLCADILAEGKSLCLFYNNPQAGMIYKKLGFNDIGTWSMMYL